MWKQTILSLSSSSSSSVQNADAAPAISGQYPFKRQVQNKNWYLHSASLMYGGLWSKKAHPWSVQFPSVPLACSKTFSWRQCAGYRKDHRFGSGSAHVRNFRNVSREQSPLPTRLWVCHRHSFVLSLVCVCVCVFVVFFTGLHGSLWSEITE